MADWQRDNPWRQGQVLDKDCARKLGLLHDEEPDETVALIITHDCDLANSPEQEPNCEVIIGAAIDEVDGGFTHAKNLRRLHLKFSAGPLRICAEFIATNRRIISKELLAEQRSLNDVRLHPDELTALQTWLAARYQRPSFPDEFDRRVKSREVRFYDKFAKIIKRTGSDVLAVYFDVDDGKNVTRAGEDDTYSLAIYLLYNAAVDPERARTTAQAAALEVEQLARQCFFAGERWRNLELVECKAISEAAMTVYQARFLRKWQFDYLSLRDEPPSPTIQTP